MRTNKFYLLLLVLFLMSCTEESDPVVEETAANIWTEKAEFPGGYLAAAVSFTIGDKLYVGTGIHDAYEDYLFVYNNMDNSWEELTSLPSHARANAISFSIGRYGYVGLGTSCIGEGLCSTTYYNDLWRYDPQNDSWRKMADFPGSPRAYLTSFVINDKAYIAGGSSAGDNDLWEYNPSTNTWIKKADYPGNCISRTVSFSANNKGYVGSGWQGYTCKDFWEYDPQTDTWKETAEFPGEPRYDAVALSLKGKGYLATGVNQGNTTRDYLTDLWKYDPVNDKWTKINTTYPGKGRLQMIAGVVNDKIIMGLGTNDYLGGPFDRFDDIWEYIPE